MALGCQPAPQNQVICVSPNPVKAPVIGAIGDPVHDVAFFLEDSPHCCGEPGFIFNEEYVHIGPSPFSSGAASMVPQRRGVRMRDF